MDVAVTQLRAQLAEWLQRARSGEEVVVTDRGVPVARLVPVDAAPLIDRLTREGALGEPIRQGRPLATGRKRVTATGPPVSELVSDQRR